MSSWLSLTHLRIGRWLRSRVVLVSVVLLCVGLALVACQPEATEGLPEEIEVTGEAESPSEAENPEAFPQEPLSGAEALGEAMGLREPVRIVLSIPLGITELGWEQMVVPSIEMALEEHNGMAGDIPVELVYMDCSEGENPYSVDKELENAQQAIEDPSVVAFIGAGSSDQARAVIPILNEAGIAYLSYGATWPGLTQPGYAPGEPGIFYPTGRRNFFRLAADNGMEGIISAEYLAEQLGAGSVYIIDDGTSYSTGVTGMFEVTARDLGLEMLAHESYDPEAATSEEFGEIVGRVIAANPDAVFWVPTAHWRNAEFLATIAQAAPDITILSGGSAIWMVIQIFPAMGIELSVADGIYTICSTPYPGSYDSEEAAAYRDNHMALYEVGVNHSFAPVLYEAVNVVLEAIARAEEPTPEGVLEALEDFGEYDGVMGSWHFTPEGDISLVRLEVSQWNSELEVVNSWEVVEVVTRER